MKNIIITGIRGKMGSYLNEYLSKKYKIYGISRKIDKKKRIYSYDQLKLSKIKFEAIIHLAGVNPEIYSGIKNNEVYKKNIKIHKKTFDLISRKKIQKVIFFSSFSVYQKTKLIDENSIISKKNLYARSKIFMEQKLLNMNISSYILRLSAILGNNSSNNWLSSVRDSVSENSDVTFFNPQSIYNNCISMDDVCLSVEKILKRNIFEKKIYNLSSNKPIQIR